jgi:diacylglycerol kinase family enzyme/membrane-associated phospholipid phosphatase
LTAVTLPSGQPAPILVVLNPAAPRHEAGDVRAAIERAAAARGAPATVVEMPAGDGAQAVVDAHVCHAVREGWDRVVVAGGDGTISMVAECLARQGEHSTRLGIVAGGTTNVLARELGLPVTLDEAVAVALSSDRAIAIDAIRADDRFFFTQVGVGPDAVMIQGTSAEERKKLGRLAYLRTFLQRALRQRRRGFRIVLDGNPMRFTAWQLIVANAGSAGTPPFTWGPRIDPTDGVMELCVFDLRGAFDPFRLLWRVLSGQHRQDDRARFFRVHREIEIASNRPTLVQGDGEVIGRTPITLAVVMHAVSVIVGREVEPEDGAADGATSSVSAPAPTTGPDASESPEEPGAAPPPESVAADVETMVAQRSRTWVLQGVLRHPATWLQALDAAIFLRLNNLQLGTAMDRAIVGITNLMHYGEGWAIALLAMMAVDLPTGWRATVEILPVLWLTMLTVNFPLKAAFRRRRPFLAFVKARVLGPRPKDFSFPSGHSAAAFGGALLLAFHAPEAAPVFFVVAVLVAFSRVYLGVHYPSDVVIGGGAGMLLALGYRALFRLVFPGLA